MIPAAFDYESPATIEEAIELLASLGDRAKIMAGGHSLIPIMKLRLAQPEVLIDLGRIGNLRYIRLEDEQIVIGAMATHADVATSELIRRQSQILSDTAKQIGDQQVRNRGTIGGALAHADPAADYPATILAVEAQIIAQGPSGSRVIKAFDFFTGLLTTALAPDELLVEVRVPIQKDAAGGVYLKFENKASHYAVVGVAAYVHMLAGTFSSVGIGITGAGSQPIRAASVESALLGKRPTPDVIEAASAFAAEGLDLLSDIHGSVEYRAHITRVYTRRAIEAAVARAIG